MGTERSSSVGSAPAARLTALAVLLCAGLAVPGPAGGNQGPEAPDFTLRDLSGTPVSLTASLEHGPALIVFWASCCSNMHPVMAEMQRLHDAYADSGLTVLGISEDDNRTAARVRPWVLARRLTFPVLLDGRGEIMRRYGHEQIPAFALVSPQRRIVWARRGFLPGDEVVIERAVREQLGARAPAESTGEEAGE